MENSIEFVGGEPVNAAGTSLETPFQRLRGPKTGRNWTGPQLATTESARNVKTDYLAYFPAIFRILVSRHRLAGHSGIGPGAPWETAVILKVSGLLEIGYRFPELLLRDD